MSEFLVWFFSFVDYSVTGCLLYVLSIAIGFFIGFLSAVFGVGGGFLLVPLLNLLLGVPYTLATGTSLCFIVGTSLLGLIGHVKLKNYEPKVIWIVGLASTFGVVLGDMLSDTMLQIVANGNLLRFNLLMEYVFIAFLFLTALILLFTLDRTSSKNKIPILQRITWGGTTSLPNSGIASVSIIGLLLLGLFIGLCTGLLGIGGGVFLIPLLLLLIGMEYRYVVGTSLGIVFISALIGIAKKSLSDTPKINLPLALLLFSGSIVGIQVGMLVYKKIKHDKLKLYFAYLVLVCAISLLIYALIK